MSGLHRDQLHKTTSQIVSLTISGNICKVTTSKLSWEYWCLDDSLCHYDYS